LPEETLERRHPAELGPGGLTAESRWIVAGSDQEQGGGVIANTDELHELGGHGIDETSNEGVQPAAFLVERDRSAPEGGQGRLGRHSHLVGIGMHPEEGDPFGESPRRCADEAFSQLIGGGVDQLADLVHGLGAGLPSAPTGDHQGPNGLHRAVAGLGRAEGAS
jgi:hypothetical protein